MTINDARAELGLAPLLADGNSSAEKRARVRLQLRDKYGRWIEMGGSVRWKVNGKYWHGVVSGLGGNKGGVPQVAVTRDDGTKVEVAHSDIEPMKASLNAPAPGSSTGFTKVTLGKDSDGKPLSWSDAVRPGELKPGDVIHQSMVDPKDDANVVSTGEFYRVDSVEETPSPGPYKFYVVHSTHVQSGKQHTNEVNEYDRYWKASADEVRLDAADGEFDPEHDDKKYDKAIEVDSSSTNLKKPPAEEPPLTHEDIELRYSDKKVVNKRTGEVVGSYKVASASKWGTKYEVTLDNGYKTTAKSEMARNNVAAKLNQKSSTDLEQPAQKAELPAPDADAAPGSGAYGTDKHGVPFGKGSSVQYPKKGKGLASGKIESGSKGSDWFKVKRSDGVVDNVHKDNITTMSHEYEDQAYFDSHPKIDPMNPRIKDPKVRAQWDAKNVDTRPEYLVQSWDPSMNKGFRVGEGYRRLKPQMNAYGGHKGPLVYDTGVLLAIKQTDDPNAPLGDRDGYGVFRWNDGTESIVSLRDAAKDMLKSHDRPKGFIPPDATPAKAAPEPAPETKIKQTWEIAAEETAATKAADLAAESHGWSQPNNVGWRNLESSVLPGKNHSARRNPDGTYLVQSTTESLSSYDPYANPTRHVRATVADLKEAAEFARAWDERTESHPATSVDDDPAGARWKGLPGYRPDVAINYPGTDEPVVIGDRVRVAAKGLTPELEGRVVGVSPVNGIGMGYISVVGDNGIGFGKQYASSYKDDTDTFTVLEKGKKGDPLEFAPSGAPDQAVDAVVPDSADITPDEVGAIKDYGTAGYLKLNKELRTYGSTDDPRVPLLDSAIEKSPLAEEMILYRGVSDGNFLPEKFEPGQEFTDRAYMSTSTNLDYVKDEFADDLYFQIVAPAGTPALSMSKALGYDEGMDEGEYLLPRNSTLVVVSDKTDAEGIRVIKMEVRSDDTHAAGADAGLPGGQKEEAPVEGVPGAPDLEGGGPDHQAPAAEAVGLAAGTDTSSWKQVGGQAGSNEGGLYEAPDGTRYYIKTGETPSHARTELLTTRFYREAGIPIPEVTEVSHHGQVAVASKMVPGAKSDLGSRLGDEPYLDKIREGFAIDAWVQNWDVVGMVFDNIVSDENGNPFRIDTGGSLIYRAQGKPKGDAFGPEVVELDTFRDPSKKSGKVFSGITNEQMHDSGMRLQAITPEKIDEIVDGVGLDEGEAQHIKEVLKARRSFILDKLGIPEDTVVDDTPDIVEDGDAATAPAPPLPTWGPKLTQEQWDKLPDWEKELLHGTGYEPAFDPSPDAPAPTKLATPIEGDTPDEVTKAAEQVVASLGLSSDGTTKVAVGHKVTTNKGETGEVVKPTSNPNYFYVKLTSGPQAGKTLSRNTKTLTVNSPSTPAVAEPDTTVMGHTIPSDWTPTGIANEFSRPDGYRFRVDGTIDIAVISPDSKHVDYAQDVAHANDIADAHKNGEWGDPYGDEDLPDFSDAAAKAQGWNPEGEGFWRRPDGYAFMYDKNDSTINVIDPENNDIGYASSITEADELANKHKELPSDPDGLEKEPSLPGGVPRSWKWQGVIEGDPIWHREDGYAFLLDSDGTIAVYNPDSDHLGNVQTTQEAEKLTEQDKIDNSAGDAPEIPGDWNALGGADAAGMFEYESPDGYAMFLFGDGTASILSPSGAPLGKYADPELANEAVVEHRANQSAKSAPVEKVTDQYGLDPAPYKPKGKTDEDSYDYTDDPQGLLDAKGADKLQDDFQYALDHGHKYATIKFDYEESVPLEAVRDALVKAGRIDPPVAQKADATPTPTAVPPAPPGMQVASNGVHVPEEWIPDTAPGGGPNETVYFEDKAGNTYVVESDGNTTAYDNNSELIVGDVTPSKAKEIVDKGTKGKPFNPSSVPAHWNATTETADYFWFSDNNENLYRVHKDTGHVTGYALDGSTLGSWPTVTDADEAMNGPGTSAFPIPSHWTSIYSDIQSNWYQAPNGYTFSVPKDPDNGPSSQIAVYDSNGNSAGLATTVEQADVIANGAPAKASHTWPVPSEWLMTNDDPGSGTTFYKDHLDNEYRVAHSTGATHVVTADGQLLGPFDTPEKANLEGEKAVALADPADIKVGLGVTPSGEQIYEGSKVEYVKKGYGKLKGTVTGKLTANPKMIKIKTATGAIHTTHIDNVKLDPDDPNPNAAAVSSAGKSAGADDKNGNALHVGDKVSYLFGSGKGTVVGPGHSNEFVEIRDDDNGISDEYEAAEVESLNPVTQAAPKPPTGPSWTASNGKSMWIGTTVTGSKGDVGTVVGGTSNPDYVKVKITSGPNAGKTVSRSRKMLTPSGGVGYNSDGSAVKHVLPPGADPKLVGAPMPTPPVPLTPFNGTYVDDAWMDSVRASYAQKFPGKKLDDSKSFHRFTNVVKNGDKNELDYIYNKGYISDEQHQDAGMQIEAMKNAETARLAEHGELVKKYQADLKAWGLANGTDDGSFDAATFTLKGMDGAKRFVESTGRTFSVSHWKKKHQYPKLLGDTVKDYVGGSGDFNNPLFQLGEASSISIESVPYWSKDKIKALDQAMDFAERVPEDIIVLRGTGTREFVDPSTGLPYKKQGNDHWNGEEKRVDMTGMVGTVQTNWGFGSTSLDDKPAFAFKPVWVFLRVPKGHKAIGIVDTGFAGSLNHENELLLARGYSMYIHGVKEMPNGKWYVDAELVPPGWVPENHLAAQQSGLNY